MGSRKMKKLFKNFYWAGSGFAYRGLWMWTGKKNVRVIPLNNLKHWTGEEK